MAVIIVWGDDRASVDRSPERYSSEAIGVKDLRPYLYAQEVAGILREDPQRAIEYALGEMGRCEWETRKPDLFRAWSRLLGEPVSTIVATMMDESDQGLWLRNGTPFLGIIDNQRSFDILVESFEAVGGRRSAF
jgi:hypothetical protein